MFMAHEDKCCVTLKAVCLDNDKEVYISKYLPLNRGVEGHDVRVI